MIKDMNGRRVSGKEIAAGAAFIVLVKDPAKNIIFQSFEWHMPKSGTRSKTGILHRIKSDRFPIKKYGGCAIKDMNGRRLSIVDITAAAAPIVPAFLILREDATSHNAPFTAQTGGNHR